MKLTVLLSILFLVVGARSQSASVLAENANLRGTPSNSGKVVQKLPQSTELEVIKQKGPWFLVQSVDYVGWVHGNTIRLHQVAASDGASQFIPDRASVGDVELVREPDSRRVNEIEIGMTGAQVRTIAGNPKVINRTTSALGVSEQWVYERWKFIGSYEEKKLAFVHLTNGRVTSISD